MGTPSQGHLTRTERASRRRRAIAALLILSLATACTSGDSSSSGGPPSTGVPTWLASSGATYQGLRVGVADHGLAPAAELRAAWTSGSTVLANEVAYPVADDMIALVIPDAPTGTYQVELLDAATLVARGTVEHLGPRVLAFNGIGSLIDELNGDIERYANDLQERSSTGRLPLDFTTAVDALVGWTDIVVQGGATASPDEVGRISNFVAGLELLPELGAGPDEPSTFGCADRIDSHDAARAQRLRERTSIALATLTAAIPSSRSDCRSRRFW